MARGLKKIGKKLKKFAKSKAGKIIGIVAGVGATAVGAGLAVKGIKMARAAKAAKGLLGKSAVKAAKGIVGNPAVPPSETAGLMNNAISRKAKRLAKKVAKKQAKLAKKQGKVDQQKALLEAGISEAQQALGVGGGMRAEVGEVESDTMFDKLGNLRDEFRKNFNTKDEDSDGPLDAGTPGSEMSDGARKVLTGAAILGGGYLLGKSFGLIK